MISILGDKTYTEHSNFKNLKMEEAKHEIVSTRYQTKDTLLFSLEDKMLYKKNGYNKETGNIKNFKVTKPF